MNNDQQLSNAKKCDVVPSTSHVYPAFITVNMNQNNSNVTRTISLGEQRLVKFDKSPRKTVDASETVATNETVKAEKEKETSDLKQAKELQRTKLYIEKLRRKLELSQRKYRRLQEKATALAFLVKQLQDKQSKDNV